jgi:hypothetical protein
MSGGICVSAIAVQRQVVVIGLWQFPEAPDHKWLLLFGLKQLGRFRYS